MKKLILFAFVMTLFGICTTSLFAKDWRSVFVAALEKGKTVELPAGQTPAEGLAYTPPEEVVLEEAVAKAMEEKAPACECMKIAIDYEYNPYLVLKNIYSSGGDVELDQLCMCATEAGVMKAIIANAAADSVSSLDEPVFDRDEISQSQCLGGEEGLAYTAAVRPLPVSPVDNSGNRNYASKSTP